MSELTTGEQQIVDSFEEDITDLLNEVRRVKRQRDVVMGFVIGIIIFIIYIRL